MTGKEKKMNQYEYDGILGGISRISNLKSRSACAENPTGEKGKGGSLTDGTGAGCARDLGVGWKVSPSTNVPAHSKITLCNIKGEGEIRHIWMTPVGNFRFSIVRIYWDGEDFPSVECPISDFFACTHIPETDRNEFHQINSLAVCVNPRFGMNCYWTMPFRKGFRIEIENLADTDTVIYWQVDYVLGPEDEKAGYFHASFNRVNPLPYKEVYTILDKVTGKGQYVGTYMLWGVNNTGWWGEGEIKFYLDGDNEFPTICGTGTEDYFCGAYNFDDGGYREFSTPYTGMAHLGNDALYRSQSRFSLYRWHVNDPVFFDEDIKVTIQALGWRSGRRYLPLQDDISSVAFYYLSRPQPVKKLPDRDGLEIN